MRRVTAMMAISLSLMASNAPAQSARGRAAVEVFEAIAKRFGKEVAEEGAEKLSARLARASTRYGDDAIEAVNKVGPKALNLADEAAENAPQALRLLARHGDDLAPMLAKANTRSLLSRYGDDAAAVLLKHPGVAEEVIESAGQPAVRAFASLSAQEGRRLAMLSRSGDLARIGRTHELLEVIGKFGDGCMALVWRNKKILASGAVLAAFLQDPEPFVNGTVQLADSAIEHVVAPAVAPVAREASNLIKEEAPGILPWAAAIGIASLLLAGIGARSRRERDKHGR
ncbi:hypothetical protein TA3x_001094 [Tundrisphaera sp. TA3]|uniref:hypothetical protein n=1 Tax=Tundrisphaera sp. TA3 TaxID=3435775 RepID=UPI003EBF20BC